MVKELLMFLRPGVRTKITRCTVHTELGGRMGNWGTKGNINMGRRLASGELGMKVENFRGKSGLRTEIKRKVVTMTSKAIRYLTLTLRSSGRHASAAPLSSNVRVFNG